MSETLKTGGEKSAENIQNDGPWGKEYQESVPPFNPNQKSDTSIDDKREQLDEMPLDTNEQQADYLDTFMEVSYADNYQDGDENFDKSEGYPYSQKALLGREIISELREELKEPDNIGKTFFDLLKDRQRQVEQSQNDFHTTGPDGTWTKEDTIRSQLLMEQREALIDMADTLKNAAFLRGERDSVPNQENFRESYCLQKRELEKSRLQNSVDRYREEIENIANSPTLSEASKEQKINSIKSEIDDANYRLDDMELESDILKDAIMRKGEGQTTSEILQKDIATTERSIEYYKGLMDSAKSETAKNGFRRSYKEARNKLRRINAVISDLDEAENKNIRLG